MESSRPCKNCGKRTLIPDDITGKTACTSCNVVQDFDDFQAHIGGVTGVTGTSVRIGTAGSGSSHNYKERKVFEAQKLIEDFMFKLGLSGSKAHEVKLMAEKITEGEYGQGRWFSVFVGACAYVVMRQDNKMLPIVELADLVGCDVYELGRMIGRVVDFLDLKMPEFDIVNLFERSIRRCPSFNQVSEDLLKTMLQQGVFLVQCLIKWFVTTGRRPMPVVAAVLVFVGELNDICVKIEDVAKELNAAVKTSRLRYKELLKNLVNVAQVLPWGKDVTVKNIVKNAPFVIQYMEMKSMAHGEGKKRFEHNRCDIEEMARDCFSKDIGYGFDNYSMEIAAPSSNLSCDHPDKFQISPEALAMIYSNFLDEISLVKTAVESGVDNRRKRRKSFDLQECSDWWKGTSDLSKKLMLKQILEKDVGLDPTPPSFDKGCLAKERRQEKIKAAKLRIQRIMHPRMADSGICEDLCHSDSKRSEKKRKKMQIDIDWEDFIIETLLLHNVKDEEIENGHYNVLLALHVFDNGMHD